MAEEWFQTYDEDGNELALVPRSRVHATGLGHRAANVLLFRSNGELLLQKRATEKDVCPGLWDLSAAEHLMPGESYLEAANRGLAEELGITQITLTPVGPVIKVRLELPGVCDCEFQQTFRGVSDAAVYPDAKEVAAVRTATMAELHQQLELNPGRFTPWFRQLLQNHPLLD